MAKEQISTARISRARRCSRAWDALASADGEVVIGYIAGHLTARDGYIRAGRCSISSSRAGVPPAGVVAEQRSAPARKTWFLNEVLPRVRRLHRRGQSVRPAVLRPLRRDGLQAALVRLGRHRDRHSLSRSEPVFR